MPRSKELKFLREKLAHLKQRDDAAEVESVRSRIEQLQHAVAAFERGETRSPYSFNR